MADPAPDDPADHAEDFARRWADRLDEYCVTRMEALGIPDDMDGERHPTIKADSFTRVSRSIPAS